MSLKKSVLVFGSGGALGNAVAHAFAKARWRVIGCSSSSVFHGAFGDDSEETLRAPATTAVAGGTAESQLTPGIPASPEGAAWVAAGERWKATAAPPHVVIQVATQSFKQAFSLQKQGEELAKQLQPLLASGPPIYAAVCCSGAFDMSSLTSPFFLDEAQRLIKANCWPALLCAHISAQLQQQQQLQMLLVFIGAGVIAKNQPTPSMIAYGCAKAYIHHLVRSIAAASAIKAADLAASSIAADASLSEKSVEQSGTAGQGPDSHTEKELDSLPAVAAKARTAEPKEEGPGLSVLGLMPFILDTPSNRENMKNVSESVRRNTWTPVADVAQQILQWAENLDTAKNGTMYLVKTKRGKTEFTPVQN